jgi:ComF family protein
MLVHALKYRGLRQAGHLLAAGMAQVCADMQGEWDVLAPVPLHRRRQRQRGYNQAEVLARETGVVCGLPVACLLLRSRATMEQARLTREARSQNLQGAFAVRGQVRGLRILLVDDVCTTGATGEAAAIALREAGAQAVSLLTATIAVYRGG